MTLDDFMRDTLRAAQEKFPDAGLLMVVVEDVDGTDEYEATMMTNMDPEEVNDVVSNFPNDAGSVLVRTDKVRFN